MQTAFPGVPKVLVPLHGRPMLRWVVDSLTSVEALSEVAVVVGPSALEAVRRALDGAAVRMVIQELPLGTGDAAKVGLSAVPAETETVLIVYGDQPLIKPSTIEHLLRQHARQHAVLTFLTVNIDQSPSELHALFEDWGRVIRNGAGRPLRVVEMRDASPIEKLSREVNPSVYCINADWLRKELPRIKPTNAQGEYYLTDVIEIASRDGLSIVTVPVGDPREVLGANDPDQLMLLEKVASSLH